MGYILSTLLRAKPLWLELAGTFLLVAIGTSALVTLNISGEATTAAVVLVTILAFALPYGWLIYAFHRHNNGYFNPAATLLMYFEGRLSLSVAASLMLAQLAGAILASVTIALLYGSAAVNIGLGAVHPVTAMGPWAATVAEAVGTACVMIALLRLDRTASAEKQGVLVGIGMAIGQLVSVGASGAALNPARAIAPQLAAAETNGWWVYWLGPIVAVVLVWVAHRWIVRPITASQAQPEAISAGPEDTQDEVGIAADEPSAAVESAYQTPGTTDEPTDTELPPTPVNQLPANTLQPSFQPDEEEALPATVKQQSAKPRTPLPAPSAVRFVDFDQPVENSSTNTNNTNEDS